MGKLQCGSCSACKSMPPWAPENLRKLDPATQRKVVARVKKTLKEREKFHVKEPEPKVPAQDEEVPTESMDDISPPVTAQKETVTAKEALQESPSESFADSTTPALGKPTTQIPERPAVEQAQVPVASVAATKSVPQNQEIFPMQPTGSAKTAQTSTDDIDPFGLYNDSQTVAAGDVTASSDFVDPFMDFVKPPQQEKRMTLDDLLSFDDTLASKANTQTTASATSLNPTTQGSSIVNSVMQTSDQATSYEDREPPSAKSFGAFQDFEDESAAVPELQDGKTILETQTATETEIQVEKENEDDQAEQLVQELEEQLVMEEPQKTVDIAPILGSIASAPARSPRRQKESLPNPSKGADVAGETTGIRVEGRHTGVVLTVERKEDNSDDEVEAVPAPSVDMSKTNCRNCTQLQARLRASEAKIAKLKKSVTKRDGIIQKMKSAQAGSSEALLQQEVESLRMTCQYLYQQIESNGT